jgi:hypothetical protein
MVKRLFVVTEKYKPVCFDSPGWLNADLASMVVALQVIEPLPL